MEATELFCHWLNGFFQLTNPSRITPKQTSLIREQLQAAMHHGKVQFLDPYGKPDGFALFTGCEARDIPLSTENTDVGYTDETQHGWDQITKASGISIANVSDGSIVWRDCSGIYREADCAPQ